MQVLLLLVLLLVLGVASVLGAPSKQRSKFGADLSKEDLQFLFGNEHPKDASYVHISVHPRKIRQAGVNKERWKTGQHDLPNANALLHNDTLSTNNLHYNPTKDNHNEVDNHRSQSELISNSVEPNNYKKSNDKDQLVDSLAQSVVQINPIIALSHNIRKDVDRKQTITVTGVDISEKDEQIKQFMELKRLEPISKHDTEEILPGAVIDNEGINKINAIEKSEPEAETITEEYLLAEQLVDNESVKIIKTTTTNSNTKNEFNMHLKEYNKESDQNLEPAIDHLEHSFAKPKKLREISNTLPDDNNNIIKTDSHDHLEDHTEEIDENNISLFNLKSTVSDHVPGSPTNSDNIPAQLTNSDPVLPNPTNQDILPLEEVTNIKAREATLVIKSSIHGTSFKTQKEEIVDQSDAGMRQMMREFLEDDGLPESPDTNGKLTGNSINTDSPLVGSMNMDPLLESSSNMDGSGLYSAKFDGSAIDEGLFTGSAESDSKKRNYQESKERHFEKSKTQPIQYEQKLKYDKNAAVIRETEEKVHMETPEDSKNDDEEPPPEEMDITITDNTGSMDIHLHTNNLLFSPHFKVVVRDKPRRHHKGYKPATKGSGGDSSGATKGSTLREAWKVSKTPEDTLESVMERTTGDKKLVDSEETYKKKMEEETEGWAGEVVEVRTLKKGDKDAHKRGSGSRGASCVFVGHSDKNPQLLVALSTCDGKGFTGLIMNGETSQLIRPVKPRATNGRRTRRDVTEDGLHVIHSTTGSRKCGISNLRAMMAPRYSIKLNGSNADDQQREFWRKSHDDDTTATTITTTTTTTTTSTTTTSSPTDGAITESSTAHHPPLTTTSSSEAQGYHHVQKRYALGTGFQKDETNIIRLWEDSEKSIHVPYQEYVEDHEDKSSNGILGELELLFRKAQNYITNWKQSVSNNQNVNQNFNQEHSQHKSNTENLEYNYRKYIKNSENFEHNIYSHENNYQNVLKNTKHGNEASTVSKEHSRPRRDLLDAYQIETAVFVDDAMYDIMQEFEGGEQDAVNKVEDVVFTLMNSVHILYTSSSMVVPITVSLVRLEILKSSVAGPAKADGEIELYLSNFCLWQKRLNRRLQDTEDDHLFWDHALLLSGLDLYSKTPDANTVIGLAWVGAMCHTSYSCTINEGTSFEAVYVITHEMGHSLGMSHDGEFRDGNECNPDTHIMSSSTGPGKIHWSACSNRELRTFLQNSEYPPDCLENTESGPDHLDFLANNKLPGERYSVEEQCSFSLGDSFSPYVTYKKPYENICRETWCQNTTHALRTHPALEGSSCGIKKICYGGVCMLKSAIEERKRERGTSVNTERPVFLTPLPTTTTTRRPKSTRRSRGYSLTDLLKKIRDMFQNYMYLKHQNSPNDTSTTSFLNMTGNNSDVPFPLVRTYTWVIKNMKKCSVACGGGYMTAEVMCVKSWALSQIADVDSNGQNEVLNAGKSFVSDEMPKRDADLEEAQGDMRIEKNREEFIASSKNKERKSPLRKRNVDAETIDFIDNKGESFGSVGTGDTRQEKTGNAPKPNEAAAITFDVNNPEFSHSHYPKSKTSQTSANTRQVNHPTNLTNQSPGVSFDNSTDSKHSIYEESIMPNLPKDSRRNDLTFIDSSFGTDKEDRLNVPGGGGTMDEDAQVIHCDLAGKPPTSWTCNTVPCKSGL